MQESCLNHLLIKYQKNQLSSSKAASLIKMLSFSVSHSLQKTCDEFNLSPHVHCNLQRIPVACENAVIGGAHFLPINHTVVI